MNTERVTATTRSWPREPTRGARVAALACALRPVASFAVALSTLALLACSKPTDPPVGSRTYRMGFSHIPPRPTIERAIATLEKWEPRGDAAIVPITPPWKSLLADTSASFLIRREYFELVKRYRDRDFMVVAMLDLTDGFDRAAESPELVALGRSIGEPAIQALYREFAVAVDSILHPDYLGLSMETNLVRAIAPPPLYANLRTTANAAAAALKARGTTAKLFSSVQVETAWGKLPATGNYAGIAQDLADFPFMDALGLSSYPNLTTVARPEDLPLDYYRRLQPDGSLPVLLTEGGWSSANVVHPSSPAMQAAYIRRLMEIADHAGLVAMLQLTFADIDVSSSGVSDPRLVPFASLGLVTSELADKPALGEWDRAFARRLR